MCRFGDGGEQLDADGEAVSVRLAPGHNGLQGVVRELDAAGIELADLQLHAPTLDDVFLDKTGRKLEGARRRGGRGRRRASTRRSRRERLRGEQVYELARRSFLRTLRQPAKIVPSLIFPLFLLAVNTAGLDATTDIPGFPTDSYLSFALAVPFIQGGIFALINAGTDLATDIETGFLNRLALTPLGGASLIAGTLGGAMALGLVQAAVYIGVGFAAGAHFEAGLGGDPGAARRWRWRSRSRSAASASSWRCGSAPARRCRACSRSSSSSSSSPRWRCPRDLIEQDWFRTIATSTRSRT